MSIKGDDYFVKNHFIKSQKDDQKHGGWPQGERLHFGVLPMATKACGGLG